ncbi:MAG: hypothetical protein HDS62_08015 [Bacteroidales bacterium]|nr:hypothetical protein [Bacteroidales bacterium]MDE6237985.1 hypothetical protein [Muribaculaceae bacterium]MDE6866714.1 hypothetical protein [Muribaculaceae bacterium]
MNQEERLKEKFGKNPGWKVPEGYFEAFCKDMSERLPEQPAQPIAEKMSAWQRMKPYVYLAAMFAGIWCMMKVFHVASQNASMNLDNPPEHIALLMESDPDLDLYALPEYKDEDYYSLIESYDNMADFEKDMGRALSSDEDGNAEEK